MANPGSLIGTTWQRQRRTYWQTPPDGRLQLLVLDDKGIGLLRRNSINVIGYVACPV